jgi:hypothetical protein
MITFQDKIFYLKNLIPEDGVGEVLQRLKMMLAHNTQRLNDIIQFETRLSKLNKDYNFQFLTKEDYDRSLSLLTKSLMDFLDELTPADLEVQANKQESRTKKNQGHLLQHIPSEMQLFKRTKCTLRLAFLEEDLLENFKMTADTVIKSVRVAEVMEVELQDRNEEPAFEITTPNNKEQFIDEDYYTEWIFYVKPIRGGQHQLTLVVSILEEVRGKERRRDVVLEEVVTIVADEPVLDTVYKSTGYATNSTQTVEPQAFAGFMQSLRKYSAVVALLLISTMATWALGTESGQWQLAKIIDTQERYENFIEKYGHKTDSRLVDEARWKIAEMLDTEKSYEVYLNETKIKKYELEALSRMEEKAYKKIIFNSITSLKNFLGRFKKGKYTQEIEDSLMVLQQQQVPVVTESKVQKDSIMLVEYQAAKADVIKTGETKKLETFLNKYEGKIQEYDKSTDVYADKLFQEAKQTLTLMKEIDKESPPQDTGKVTVKNRLDKTKKKAKVLLDFFEN